MPRALVIVDVQNDFCPPDGALAVPEGDTIVDRVNQLARSGDFDLVIATRDWHPPDHGSFAPHGPWPAHCVAGTPGAELHRDLDRAVIDVVLDKGQDPATDGYSGFDATGLAELLRERGVGEMTVVGLATDYCVKNTTLDALREGFGVSVDTKAVRGVDVEKGDAQRALDEMRTAGASLVV